MDPLSALGLVSGVVQLADASFKIIKLLDTLKDGGKDRRKLCDEITLLWMTLRNLETQFAPLSTEQDGDWMKPIDSLSEPNGIFDQLSAALDDVWGKLTTRDTRRGKMMQTLRWPLDQTYVDHTVAKIEHLKTSIIIVQGQASISLAQELREQVTAVKKATADGKFKDIVDWLSPCNFTQKQETINAAPGTGGWVFASKEFESWRSGNDRWLWCYGIPGAGKTFIASNTAKELRRLHSSDGSLVLIAFCSFDSADSQSIENLITALLKQFVQTCTTLPGNLEDLYRTHHVANTRPKLAEFCDILGQAISKLPNTYIILDALDELTDESKRLVLLETIYGLKGKPKVMVTSRRVESIANRFGYPRTGIYCDGCEKQGLDVYYHCEDCADFDLCNDCRPDRNTGEHLAGHVFIKRYSSIKLRIAAQPGDIENYVKNRIETSEDLRQMVERRPKLRMRILDTIVESAKDMFLLPRFHMDALADCLNVGEVEHALENLPEQINDIYDQAMTRIAKLSANRQRAVKRLLLWVSCSKRPLTTKELEHATAVFRGVHEIQAEHVLDARVLTSLTAGLVVIDENDDVRLTHKTAEDYFSQKRGFLFPTGDVEIAECCLAYLQLAAFEAGPCTAPNESDAFNTRLKEFPLIAYAAMHWGYHARRSSSPIVLHQALQFLRRKPLLEASVQALWYTDIESQHSWDVSGGVDPLHIAAWFGLHDVVSGLLAEGANPDTRDSMGTTPLHYACLKGHLDVATTLLDAGASANIVDNRGSTTLHYCVQLRHVELTRRLVQENDVAINAFCTSLDDFTALIIACWNEDTDTIKTLLSRSDIDVNLDSPTARWNPLLLAAEYDDHQSIELLLQHPHIDKNYRDEGGYTPIHNAATSGQINSLEALLEGGADPNVGDNQNGKPLQRAIDEDQFAAVNVLLRHNVEWNFRDTLGRTIFHAAAINDRSRILRLLLETCKDVDIDAQGDNGETALHDAARCGYLETTQVLLEFGARTDILNNSGRTPVRAAKDAEMDHLLDVLKEARDKEVALDNKHEAHLIQKQDTFATRNEQPLGVVVQQSDLETLRTRIAGTNRDQVNAYSDNFKATPLHVACDVRTVEFVDLLLEAGATVNPMDAFFRTPLTIACQKGDPDIVRALVKAGADVNNTKFNGRPPWEIALKNGGSKAAVFLLAQAQTDIDRTSAQLARALGWAAALGDIDACRRLVDAGAPIQLKNGNGMTPIQVAKAWDNEDVEKFLFDAAVKQRSASSPKLPTIETLKQDEVTPKVVQENGIGHPPTRSPTSKKEFMDLIKPESKNSKELRAEHSLWKTIKQISPFLSFSNIVMLLGLLAMFLPLVWRR